MLDVLNTSKKNVSINDRFSGCIIGGAIGDAIGYAYENKSKSEVDISNETLLSNWHISDDTQLTLATCESILDNNRFSTEALAQKFLADYRAGRINGIGSATLAALKGLAAGGHWGLVGRRGEYAAGNGAAMRIAPLAFCSGLDREQLRDACRLTHHNDEAYVGALSVFLAIKAAVSEQWQGGKNLLAIIIAQIPDTRVRDRLIEIEALGSSASLEEIGKLGSSGYVVESVPLAIAAAGNVETLGFEEMYRQLILIGGDTDTNCSIAGQIAGTFTGKVGLPNHLLEVLAKLPDITRLEQVIQKFSMQVLK